MRKTYARPSHYIFVRCILFLDSVSQGTLRSHTHTQINEMCSSVCMKLMLVQCYTIMHMHSAVAGWRSTMYIHAKLRFYSGTSHKWSGCRVKCHGIIIITFGRKNCWLWWTKWLHTLCCLFLFGRVHALRSNVIESGLFSYRGCVGQSATTHTSNSRHLHVPHANTTIQVPSKHAISSEKLRSTNHIKRSCLSHIDGYTKINLTHTFVIPCLHPLLELML